MSWDPYATPKHQQVLAWIASKRRILLPCTPPSAAWANWVERCCALLPQQQVRRGVGTAVPPPEQGLEEYGQGSHANPRPRVWTQRVEEILERVRRGRAALPRAT